MEEKKEKGKISFVATPIGNLGDFSWRAIETLKNVDIILCEDTRHSLKLLNYYQIKKPLESYHKFNFSKKIPDVIKRLNEGINFALITDAGMPAISDPGSEIVSALVQNEINYEIIPGACAFVCAFALSGFEMPMSFFGFLPEKNSEKSKLLNDVKSAKGSLIFYCSPHSIKDDIKTLYNIFGERKIFIANEITKLFEKHIFSSLSKQLDFETKGEYVLVVEGLKIDENELNNLTIEKHYEYYIKLNFEKNDAIKQVAKDRKVPKNEIYNYLVKNKAQ